MMMKLGEWAGLTLDEIEDECVSRKYTMNLVLSVSREYTMNLVPANRLKQHTWYHVPNIPYILHAPLIL